MNGDSDVARLEQGLLAFDRVATASLLKNLSRDLTPRELIDSVVVPALERIGKGWEQGTVALSQVYVSGVLIENFIDSLMPPASPERIQQPKMAIALLEDHHFLGKRIVYSHLRASGFDLTDYGRVTVDSLVDLIRRDEIRILLISVLMLPSALRVKDLRTRLKATGLDAHIIVGGAPFRFDPQLWREVGADAMGEAAEDAARLVAEAREALS